MQKILERFSGRFPRERSQIAIDTILQIMAANHGMVSSTMIKPLKISQQYFSIMQDKQLLEKVVR